MLSFHGKTRGYSLEVLETVGGNQVVLHHNNFRVCFEENKPYFIKLVNYPIEQTVIDSMKKSISDSLSSVSGKTRYQGKKAVKAIREKNEQVYQILKTIIIDEKIRVSNSNRRFFYLIMHNRNKKAYFLYKSFDTNIEKKAFFCMVADKMENIKNKIDNSKILSDIEKNVFYYDKAYTVYQRILRNSLIVPSISRLTVYEIQDIYNIKNLVKAVKKGEKAVKKKASKKNKPVYNAIRQNKHNIRLLLSNRNSQEIRDKIRKKIAKIRELEVSLIK